MAKMTPEQVKEFWTKQALSNKDSYTASWTDKYMMNLECDAISKYIEEEDLVLDVGCANGYTTNRIAKQTGSTIHGIDYIPEMIEVANKNKPNNVMYSVGDITKLNFMDGFNVVMGIRVLINLPNHDVQVNAMNRCLDALVPGGLYLMSEATLQGWERINTFRYDNDLTRIPIPDFNVYLDEDEIVSALQPRARLIGIQNFSSTYFVGTRIIKPLLCKPEEAVNPNSEWNRFFSMLPPFGDYGTQKLFIWLKK